LRYREQLAHITEATTILLSDKTIFARADQIHKSFRTLNTLQLKTILLSFRPDKCDLLHLCSFESLTQTTFFQNVADTGARGQPGHGDAIGCAGAGASARFRHCRTPPSRSSCGFDLTE
jgi:hypothetical protein